MVRDRNLAEGKGFEPLETCASLVFKTSAFDRSAIPPFRGDYFTAEWRGRTMPFPLGEVLEWLNRAAC